MKNEFKGKIISEFELERSGKKIYAKKKKSKNSFLKNKFTVLNNFADSQELSEQLVNLVILRLSMQRKLTHLDKKLKHRLYFF